MPGWARESSFCWQVCVDWLVGWFFGVGSVEKCFYGRNALPVLGTWPFTCLVFIALFCFVYVCICHRLLSLYLFPQTGPLGFLKVAALPDQDELEAIAGEFLVFVVAKQT